MGNWNICIQGIGSHHNDPEYQNYSKDANKMMSGFVDALKRAGHNIEIAAFTYGSKDDMTPKKGNG